MMRAQVLTFVVLGVTLALFALGGTMVLLRYVVGPIVGAGQ